MKTFWIVFCLLIFTTLAYIFIFEAGVYYLTSVVEVPAYDYYIHVFTILYLVGVLLTIEENKK